MFANLDTRLASEVHVPADPDSPTIRVGDVWYSREGDALPSCDGCALWRLPAGCLLGGFNGKFVVVQGTCVATSTHFVPSLPTQQELF